MVETDRKVSECRREHGGSCVESRNRKGRQRSPDREEIYGHETQ